MQYPSTRTPVRNRILAKWLVTLQNDTQMRPMMPELCKASTQYCLQHRFASSELLGEMCTTLPELPNSERNSWGYSELIPPHFWRQSDCLLSYLSGHVTPRTPEGHHSPQMMMPGKTAAKPRVKWATVSQSSASPFSGLHHTSEWCRAKIHGFGNRDLGLKPNSYFLWPWTSDLNPPNHGLLICKNRVQK